MKRRFEQTCELLCLLIVLTITGCDIDQSGRPMEQPWVTSAPTDECRAAKEMNLFEIESFELGIGPNFWVSSDGTGTVTPLPGREPEATSIDGGRCGESLYALHIVAVDTTVFGGAVGKNFYPNLIDASEFEGISFFARGDPQMGHTLFLSVIDPNTDQWLSTQLSADNHPHCMDETDDPAKKCDRFSASFGVDETWRHFLIPFSALSQRGFGKPEAALDLTRLGGLSFAFDAGDVEFWIDDIALYKE